MRSGAEVIVIGGGVIGTSVAYFVARLGHKVILLERQNLSSGASGACDGTLFLQTKNPGPHLQMALKSIALYGVLSEELDYDFEYEQKGGMCLIEDEAQAELMQHTLAQQRQSGLTVELFDIKRAREIEPMLGGHLWGATYCAADTQVNPLAVSRGFSRAARRHGADIRVGVERDRPAGERWTGARCRYHRWSNLRRLRRQCGGNLGASADPEIRL